MDAEEKVGKLHKANLFYFFVCFVLSMITKKKGGRRNKGGAP